MELSTDIRRAPMRPMAMVTAALFAITIAFFGGYAFANSAQAHPTNGAQPTVTTSPLLDRGAEREPQGPLSEGTAHQ